MENDYLTKNPAAFTVAAVLIFLFTSGVFLLYDVCVERRQRKVMNTAINSTANVSLLEEKVKERTRKLEISNGRLEEANRRVLSASAAQLQHFACMSHEIRTPLNCIIGLSSLLQDTDLNPMQEESMRMIVTSGDVLLTVVNDVLDYSKLESGNVEIMIQRCNLQEILNSVVHSIQTQGLSKNLSVRTFYDAAICEFINTDGRRLQQILYNLLGNAIKFSKEGGAVELSISLCSPCSSQDGTNSYSPPEREGSSEFVKAHGAEDKVLRFEIKDYGKGINAKDFVRIFQPFRQASAETEALYGGSGLGLAISTKLVYRLGGSISVESEEGNWSKFTIDFPFDDTPADIEDISARLKKATIFLVGDEGETAEQVGDMFRQYNVDFARFSNLRELEAKITMKGTLSRDRSYIYLVHEDLYDRGIHKVLPSCEHSVLLTFGPTYGVKEARGHFRSLVDMLPSVLMKRLVVYVQELRKAPRDLVRLDSNTAATIVPYHEFRVLIAEDNLINQKVLSRMLTKLGVTNLTIVDDGEKAVEREAAEAFDVIFMDMQMPRMDGIDACRHIDLRQGGHPKAKVVFVTAQVSQSFKVECRVAGAVGFISKPCKIRDIENCFQRLHAMSAVSYSEDANVIPSRATI
jgi:signal transduction histidine kinase/FixJ family two-component response regulator